MKSSKQLQQELVDLVQSSEVPKARPSFQTERDKLLSLAFNLLTKRINTSSDGKLDVNFFEYAKQFMYKQSLVLMPPRRDPLMVQINSYMYDDNLVHDDNYFAQIEQLLDEIYTKLKDLAELEKTTLANRPKRSGNKTVTFSAETQIIERKPGQPSYSETILNREANMQYLDVRNAFLVLLLCIYAVMWLTPEKTPSPKPSI